MEIDKKNEQNSLKSNFLPKGQGEGQKSKRTFSSFFDARHNIYTKLSSANNTSRVITANGNANTLKLPKITAFLHF